MTARDINHRLTFSNGSAKYRVIFPVKGKQDVWFVEHHLISSTFPNRIKKKTSAIIEMSADEIITIIDRCIGDSLVRDIQTVGMMPGERASSKTSKWRYLFRFSRHCSHDALVQAS